MEEIFDPAPNDTFKYKCPGSNTFCPYNCCFVANGKCATA